eukprot:jgi/Mesvir1/26883/Mv20617-RA.1
MQGNSSWDGRCALDACCLPHRAAAVADDVQRAVELKNGSLVEGRKLKVESALRRAPLEERRPSLHAGADGAKGEKSHADAPAGRAAADGDDAPDPGRKKKRKAAAEDTEEGAAGDATTKGGASASGPDDKVTKKKKKEAAGESAKEVAMQRGESGKGGGVGSAENPGKGARGGGDKAAAGVAKASVDQRGAKESVKAKGVKDHVDEPPKPSEKQRPARTVVIGCLPSESAVGQALELAKATAPVESVINPLPATELEQHALAKDGCAPLAVSVVFVSVAGARAAVQALHGHTLKGGAVAWARQLAGEGIHWKKWRVIARNLPFTDTEADVRRLFSKAGFVWDLQLPKNAQGKSRGFAFAAYTCKADAEKAIAELNGHTDNNRPIAVDWAVSKNVFDSHKQQLMQQQAGEGIICLLQPHAPPPNRGPRQKIQVDDVDMLRRVMSQVVSSQDDDHDGDGKQPAQRDEDGTPAAKKKEKTQAAKAQPPSENSGGKPKLGAAEGHGPQQTATAGSTGTSINGSKSQPSQPPAAFTVFVRNLPLVCTSAELKLRMAAFGVVAACRVVMNKTTGQSKGNAFVEFRTQQGADAAVDVAQSAKGMTIAGQRLTVHHAVTGDKAKEMMMATHVGGGKERDKRNMYLAKEGYIPADSPAAASMSKSDLTKRERLEEQAQTKLRSPNFFVSKTRLTVHNLPTSVTDKELKALFLKAVRDRASKEHPKIHQVKLLRDPAKPGDPEGQGRSRGAGFVEFDNPEHALVALRALNNNPEPFGKDKRPIIRFAIENAKILKKRERMLEIRQARQKEKDAEGQPGGGASPGAPGGRPSKKRFGGNNPAEVLHPMGRHAVDDMGLPAGDVVRDGGKKKQPQSRKQRKHGSRDTDNLDKIAANYESRVFGGGGGTGKSGSGATPGNKRGAKAPGSAELLSAAALKKSISAGMQRWFDA